MNWLIREKILTYFYNNVRLLCVPLQTSIPKLSELNAMQNLFWKVDHLAKKFRCFWRIESLL